MLGTAFLSRIRQIRHVAMKSPGKKNRCQPGNSPAGRAPTRSRFQSHKSRRATELGERLSLASQPRSSSICCRWIGILSNRIHIGQPFFLGPIPRQTRSKHENFDVRSSLAQLRTNDDFNPWCIGLNVLCWYHDEFVCFQVLCFECESWY